MDAFNLAVFPFEINIPGYGDILGVEQWLLLRSHWSSNRNNSSAVGPPFGIGSGVNKRMIITISKIKTIKQKLYNKLMKS